MGETDTLARDTVLIEHLWDFENIPPSEGIRTDQWKYLRYVDSPTIEELYDLNEDPQETNNLAGDLSHQEMLVELRARFIQLAEHYDTATGE